MRDSALIFGGTSGVGRAIAEELGRRGRRVTVASRRPADERARFAGIEHAICDVRDYAAVDALVDQVTAHDPAAAIVSTVGVGLYAPLGSDHSAQWLEILETNVVGAANLASALLVRGDSFGHCVYVSSLAAHRVSRTPGNLMYSVSKMGAATVIAELRRVLRQDRRRGRVTLVTPGFVAGTEWGDTFFRDDPDAARDLYGAFAGLTPGDVADAALYALHAPEGVDVSEIVLRPVEQPD